MDPRGVNIVPAQGLGVGSGVHNNYVRSFVEYNAKL